MAVGAAALQAYASAMVFLAQDFDAGAPADERRLAAPGIHAARAKRDPAQP
jgi:hypothetical protein